MKTIGEILEENNLTVDLIHNKAMTERVYKAMEEYASQKSGLTVGKTECLKQYYTLKELFNMSLNNKK
jgi:hypothetical protein